MSEQIDDQLREEKQLAEKARRELAQKELLNLELKKGLTDLSNGCMGTIIACLCVLGFIVILCIIVGILQTMGIIKS